MLKLISGMILAVSLAIAVGAAVGWQFSQAPKTTKGAGNPNASASLLQGTPNQPNARQSPRQNTVISSPKPNSKAGNSANSNHLDAEESPPIQALW